MDLTTEDKRQIRESIQDKYKKVAQTPEGRFRYPTGRKGMIQLEYPREIQDLPEEVLTCFCGVGNPFSLGSLHPGYRVLDVGCGCGVDTILAALLIAPNGWADGIDVVPEMISRAEENRRKAGISNCSFEEGDAEALPFPEASIDAVISNGALNLVPDKKRALREMRRVLKPASSLLLADEVLVGSLPENKQERLQKWSG
jgi:SAM-dependent methyltransferase